MTPTETLALVAIVVPGIFIGLFTESRVRYFIIGSWFGAGMMILSRMLFAGA